MKNRKITRARVRGVTIDGPTSKDLDDAIWVSKREKGYLVTVSVADVSSAFRMRRGIDLAALSKGFTRYYAEGNKPMLPRFLSEGMLSLFQGKPRNVVTVEIPLDENLNVGEPQISLRILVSEAKLSYGIVDHLIKEGTESELKSMLVLARDISEGLLAKRRGGGALAIYDIFSGWKTSEEGNLRKVIPEERHIANIIVQEMMILANIAVAQFMVSKDIPVLFRNHTAKTSAPARSQLISDFERSVRDPVNFNIETLQSRVLMVLNRATYGPVLEGHFGLNLPAYLHFTSPIRRYPDLVVHRQLLAVLSGVSLPYDVEKLQEIASSINVIEREIKERREKSFKEKDHSQTKKIIARDIFVSLNPDDMHKVIKRSIDSGEVGEALSEELCIRADKGMLAPRDAFFLLFEATQSSVAWVGIKKRVFEWLEKHPENSVTVINIAQQAGRVLALDFTFQPIGPDHNRSFQGKGTVSWKDGDLVKAEASGSTKKQAQQKVTVELIRLMLISAGVPLSQPKINIGDAASIVSETRKQEEASPAMKDENYVSALQEWLMARRLPLPEYRMSLSGPSHIPEITYTVVLSIGGTNCVTGEGKGPNKKVAKQLAAKSIWTEVTKLAAIPK